MKKTNNSKAFNDADRILIIRLSSLGDVILTTPIIRALKNTYPNLKIDFLCFSSFSDALKYNPHISSVISFSKSDSLDKIIETLKENNYDLILDLHNNFRSNKILRSLKAPFYQYKKPTLAKFLLVKFKINLLKELTPVTERYIKNFNDIKLDEKAPEIFLGSENKSQLSYDKKYIAICPGSQHYTKMWPKEYYIELGNLLCERGYTVVLIGGRSDKTVCKEISEKVTGSIDLSNDNDLLQLAANLQTCKTAICNDSGMMHTAYSVGVPVAAFFGSTVKELGFYPYKTINLILENNSLNCRPCSHIGRNKCPKKHFKCMRELTPIQVIDRITQFIEKNSN